MCLWQVPKMWLSKASLFLGKLLGKEELLSHLQQGISTSFPERSDSIAGWISQGTRQIVLPHQPLPCSPWKAPAQDSRLGLAMAAVPAGTAPTCIPRPHPIIQGTALLTHRHQEGSWATPGCSELCHFSSFPLSRYKLMP